MEKPTDNASPTTTTTTGGNTLQPVADTFRKRRLSLPRHHLSAEDDAEAGDDTEAAGSAAAAAGSASPPPEQVYHPGMSSSTLLLPGAPNTQDKAHTFRKRRLSLTSKLNAGHENGGGGGEDTDIHTGIDIHTRPDGSWERPKRRRSSCASTGSHHSAGSQSQQHQPPLQSRTVHATELLPNQGPPPSPAVYNNILYQHYAPIPPDLTLPAAAAVNGNNSMGNIGNNGMTTTTSNGGIHLTQRPAANANTAANAAAEGELPVVVPHWKTSHHLAKTGEDDHKLPFPRDIVGTYSCHGAEPVYDSGSNEDDEDDDEDDDEASDDSGNGDYQDQGGLPSGKKLAVPTIATTKPTSVAKINQDRGGVAFPYGNSPHTALFAVYDGHGQGGEMVSQYALHEIQRRLEQHSHFRKDLVKAFKETFLAVDEALETEPGIEPVFAGTTACVALLKGDVLTCANAGDSRAVVAQRHPTLYTLSATDLTVDQNPDLPDEMQRIHAAGGYVSPPPAPGLSARVWLDPHCTQIGLAMARSIGDHAVSTVGVIAEPVVTKHKIAPNDEFLILASDGVWEFISSQEAVDIVGEHLDQGATKACQALIEAAAAKWHEEEGDYRDDITALVVCLQDLWTMSP